MAGPAVNCGNTITLRGRTCEKSRPALVKMSRKNRGSHVCRRARTTNAGTHCTEFSFLLRAEATRPGSVFSLLPIKAAVNNWQPSDEPVASYVSGHLTCALALTRGFASFLLLGCTWFTWDEARDWKRKQPKTSYARLDQLTAEDMSTCMGFDVGAVLQIRFAPF